eukprot:evm.model.NODE_25240_length_35198_cov_29.221746.8
MNATFVAGTSGVFATVDRQDSSVNPRRVKSFKFCSRPVIDSVSFQPLLHLDGDTFMNNVTVPYLFFPYKGYPESIDSDFPLYGAFGNILQADFGFKSNMNDCNKPLFVSSVVKGVEFSTRGRMLQGDPFETAYTEYTVEYSRAAGWNPFYLSSKK